MRKIAIGLLLLTLTACGGTVSPNTGSDSTGSTGESPAASAAPSAMPSASTPAGGDAPVSGAPGSDPLMPAGDIEQNVMALLSTTTGKPADTLKLQNKEEVEWPNGALGCPQDGMMYTEMLVPGYKLTYTDGSATYEVHTDRTGNTAIWCDNGQPKNLGIS